MKTQIKKLQEWWSIQMELARYEELQDYKEYRDLVNKQQQTYNELLEARSELERANLYLDVFVGACVHTVFSSRVCERGTKGCEIYHGVKNDYY